MSAPTATQRTLAWTCGTSLIVGALLVGSAGLFHPMLVGDAPEQLATIAAVDGWRLTHWAIAFGYIAVLVGLITASSLHHVTDGAAWARLGAAVAVFGYAISLVGVLFMLGPARALAEAHPKTADAAFLYDLLHPFALAALRLGAFAVSLALCAFGLAVRAGGLWPRWIGSIALVAGALGAAVGVYVSEHSPATVAGIALATVWELVVGAFLVDRGVRAHLRHRVRVGDLTRGTAG